MSKASSAHGVVEPGVYDSPRLAGTTLLIEGRGAYRVQTEFIAIGRRVTEHAGEWAVRAFGRGSVLVVADENTIPFGDILLESLSRAGLSGTSLLLSEAPDGHVVADEKNVGLVMKALQEEGRRYRGVIALGSGTINDLSKMSAHRVGLPYGVVATAASMNGYTSRIAALLVGGVKRTVEATPPRFVLADLDVVARAPIDMARAGLGDLMSKPVSGSDWRLSDILLQTGYSETPVRLVDHAFERTRSHAEGIRRGDPDALGVLMDALLISGISMSAAGSSAPASGGEHLISHLWDMTAPYRGRRVGLHGAQVGVATLLTAGLYHILRENRPRDTLIAARCEAWEPFEGHQAALLSLPREIRRQVSQTSAQKHPTKEQLRQRLEKIVAEWDDIWTRIGPALLDPADLRAVLKAAGAPTTIRELGIPEHELREAWRIARDIRARYTVLDLVWDLGWTDVLEERVLALSGISD